MSDYPMRPLRIVVFDDNAADVHLLRETLAENGITCELEVFHDGEQINGYLPSAKAVDLFVIDLNLPKITGDEILARIRQDETLAVVPVLILTSSNSTRDRDRAMKLGATAFVCKPCTLDEYFEIGKVIEGLLRPERPDEAAGRTGEASETPSGSRG
jgi:two-component system, chemotaxis family, response regulator Rcp1